MAVRDAGAAEVDAYERLLGDAMKGDATLFAREDAVEAAWGIVDPILDNATPVHPYAPGTWGPAEANALIRGDEGWHDPLKRIVKQKPAETVEGRRLEENNLRTTHWNRWGPYLSERAWGTVREDYSADGAAWDYFPHDHARVARVPLERGRPRRASPTGTSSSASRCRSGTGRTRSSRSACSA